MYDIFMLVEESRKTGTFGGINWKNFSPKLGFSIKRTRMVSETYFQEGQHNQESDSETWTMPSSSTSHRHYRPIILPLLRSSDHHHHLVLLIIAASPESGSITMPSFDKSTVTVTSIHGSGPEKKTLAVTTGFKCLADEATNK